MEDRLARRTFFSSVVVLAGNDWLLKGAGLLPGWLTGKLSDLAGMIVAPVVLVTILTLARVPARIALGTAVAAVAVGFAALKLSTPAAAAFDQLVDGALTALSLPLASRTVSDATDLVALPLLGLGRWVAGRLAGDRDTRRSGALVLGMLACAATSVGPPQLPPHWGLAGQQETLWGSRVASGAVVVQLGRQSSDGAFEIGVELAARDGELGLDARDVVAELGGTRVAAQSPAGQPSSVRVAPGDTESLRFFFTPRATTWRQGTEGALTIGIADGPRSTKLRVPLVFDERSAGWHRLPKLR